VQAEENATFKQARATPRSLVVLGGNKVEEVPREEGPSRPLD
jgi:hypothetical protein